MLSFPLLGRSRSWAVLSLLSLLVVAISPSTQAQGYPGGGSSGGGSYYIDEGSYVGPVYTGGTVTTSTTSDYSLNSAGTYGGQYYAGGGTDTNGNNPSSGSVTCSGEIKTAYTWQNANMPPPQCVIVVEHCIAQWHGSAFGGATLTGGCTNPLGGSSVPDMPGPGATWEYTKYTAQNATAQNGFLAAVSASCSPEADTEAAGFAGAYSAANGTASVGYTATIIIPPPLQAHSTVDTNGTVGANSNYTHPWDPYHPRFFSGTNCSVVGTATAYSSPPGYASYPAGGRYVKQAMLSIGGTPVKYYYDTAFYGPYQPGAILGQNQSSVPLSVFFDSTHFADGSAISAQMTVTDSGGLTYTVNLSGPACNNLVAVANQTSSAVDPTTGENVAINAANGQAKGQKGDPNFQPYPGVMTQSSPNNIGAVGIFYHHKGDLINDIAASGYTVFFAVTHAAPGALGDCYSVSGTDPAYDPGAYLHDADIQGAIATRTTALSAPYLFAYLYGCNGASDPTTIAADFGFSQTSSDDRAFLGYAADIAVTQQNTNFAVQVWHDLMQGQTLDAARTEAASDYHIQPWPYLNSNTTTVIWGDPNMTLHGKVYNWTSGPTWYR